MGEEIEKLRTTVEKQQSTIQDLQKLKEDFKKMSHSNISQMNVLVDQQRQQVETIRTLKKEITSDTQTQKQQLQDFQTTQEVSQRNLQQQIHQAKEIADHKALLDEVFKKRHNLILTGISEKEDNNERSEVTTFFKDHLKLKNVQIITAYRLGRPPHDGRAYDRPILVKFSRLSDRNRVWRMRHDVPQIEGQTRKKIQADLPKKIRDNVNILYRVIQAASNIEDFKTAYIRDFAVMLHGKQYTADNLELLPPPLRPSSLSVRESDEALVFFSRFCFLSNHYPSQFIIDGQSFHHVEQFLAYKKAQLSQKDEVIQRALQASDPVEAKSILNLLHKDYLHEWEKIRDDVTTTALRQKFTQNSQLAAMLKDTRNLKLGEASKDPSWGVGFTLEDQEVLDVRKWTPHGNLLGKTLMKIRDELTTGPHN